MTKGKLKEKKKKGRPGCMLCVFNPLQMQCRRQVNSRYLPFLDSLLSVDRGKCVKPLTLSGKLKIIFRLSSKALARVSVGRTDVFPGGRCLEQAVLTRSWTAAGVTSRDLSVWLGQSSVVPRDPPRASGSSETTVGDALLSPQSRPPGATSPAGAGATGGRGFVFSSLPCPPMLLWFEGMWLAPQLLALLLA